MKSLATPSLKFFAAGVVFCLAFGATTVSASAGKGATSRDHRGQDGAPQGGVSVTPGQKPKTAPDVTSRIKTTTSGGVTTRDHRKAPKSKGPNGKR